MGNKGYESLVHQWGVFRLPVFYVGIVVGQGMLHVRLTAQACVILGRIADVLSLLMVAAAFFPYSCNLMDPSTRIEFTMTDPVSGDTYTVLRDTTSCKDGGIWQITPSFVVETLHCPLLSFLLFVFCRAPRATLVGRFLGNRFLRELVPYTYAIYICHWIVIKWAKWARVDWLTFAPYSAVITLEIPRPPLHQVRSRGIRRIFPSRWATPVESLLGFPYLGGMSQTEPELGELKKGRSAHRLWTAKTAQRRMTEVRRRWTSHWTTKQEAKRPSLEMRHLQC